MFLTALLKLSFSAAVTVRIGAVRYGVYSMHSMYSTARYSMYGTVHCAQFVSSMYSVYCTICTACTVCTDRTIFIVCTMRTVCTECIHAPNSLYLVLGTEYTKYTRCCQISTSISYLPTHTFLEKKVQRFSERGQTLATSLFSRRQSWGIPVQKIVIHIN